MFLLLEHVSGYRRHPLTAILSAGQQVAAVPAEPALLFRLTVAAELRAAGRAADGLGVLEGLLVQLADEGAPSWTLARVRHVIADVLLAERRYAEALAEALASWAVLDECRYRTGSARLRRTIHDSYALARRTAMSAAAALRDWALLSELIESARLQAGSDIEGSLAEFDAAAAGRQPAPPGRSGATRTINLSALPAPYSLIYEDLTGSRTDLAPPADVTVAGRSAIAAARDSQRSTALHVTEDRRLLPLEACLAAAGRTALWWSSWHERGLIFWTTLSRSGLSDGGQIDLAADPGLRAALAACCDGNGLPAPWLHRGPAPDLHQALLACDSPAELDLTRTLARLIPPQILRAPGSSGEQWRRLLISPAPELACVPWPVLPVGGLAESPIRLIEQYELQFAPSLASIASAALAGSRAQAGSVPFVMSCDYFDPDNFPTPPRKADTRFGTMRQRASHPGTKLAAPEAVASFLRGLDPGCPGLSVFRTHFASADGDPAMSGFELYGGRLEVGWLMPRDRQKGRTILGMTSRVLLSCCSTAASRERYGGESLGLVAACVQAGARMIVATSVNILHTSFSNAFDELLIDMMLTSRSHVSGLRDLQCRMLAEWRNGSRLGIQVGDGDICEPLPVIWAYYQPCGLEQEEG
jgi:CHAT domain